MNILGLVIICISLSTASGIAPLLNRESISVNPGVYLVVLKDSNIASRDTHIRSLISTISILLDGSEVLSVFNIGSLIGYSARLSADVKYIEVDQFVSIQYKQEEHKRDLTAADVQTGATWGLDRIDQRSMPLDGQYAYNSSAGSNTDVYVIDTGINTAHNEFGGRAVLAYNGVTQETGEDRNGHGTHCAGTIGGATYGVAKMARLYAVKVLDSTGSGTTRGVVDGVNYVTNNRDTSRPAVASMSLGGGISTTLDDAVSQSIASGVIYAIAAGNSAADACDTSPARVATAVTVGATNSSDYRAEYSNFGGCVSIFAPGSGITSAWIGSNTATNTISGTSMATPHCAGVLALHLTLEPTLSPASSKAWLTGVATPDVVLDSGSGSPNLLLYSPHD